MKYQLRKVHVAILMKRGKIIEVASNELGTRARGCGYSTHTIHAERALIKKLGDHTRLEGTIMIVVRISQGLMQMGNSTPCKSCKPHLEKCIKDYGLRRVYYSI
jgi:cytidine deaminase